MRRGVPTLARTGAQRYVNHAHDGTACMRIVGGGLADGPTSHAAITNQGKRSDACRRCARGLLALPIRTRALDGDANQRTPVGDHRSAILVPIRMFPGQTPIIIHERFHGFG